MTSMINDVIINGEAINGQTIPTSIPSSMKILYNQTTIVLDWSLIPAATHYQVQVSMFPDFRTTFIDIDTLIISEYSFTDGQADNAKRYWRWRPLISPGPIYFEPWSEVGSYWVDTSAAEEITLPRGTWALFSDADVTDLYELELYPTYTIVPANVYRFQERNRLGEMLSEFLTVKSDITLSFTGAQYVSHSLLNEFRRYHNSMQTFFLAAYKDGEWHRPMPHIWKAQLVQNPSMTMIAAGRDDLVAGSFTLTEV